MGCNPPTEITCVRVYGHRSVPIPIAWLGDGTADCLSGEDERPIWPTCGVGETKRFVTRNDSCNDDYLCPHDKANFIPWIQLCDMIETCGNENKVCSLSKGKLKLKTKVFIQSKYGKQKNFSYCIEGLKNLQNLTRPCKKEHFIYPPGKLKTLGIAEPKVITMPDQLINCDYLFGEPYLLVSCTHN